MGKLHLHVKEKSHLSFFKKTIERAKSLHLKSYLRATDKEDIFHILKEKLETDLINYVRYSNSILSLQTREQKFFDLLFYSKLMCS